MKIAEVVANFPPYFGGIGNSCLRFSVSLAKLGHTVTVYTSSYPKTDYEYPQELVVHRLKHQFKYGNAPLLLGLFRIKNVDIIHLHYPFYFGAEIIYLVSKFRKIPYVVTYHMDMVGTGLLKYVFAAHKKMLLAPIMKGATRIYVSSTDYGLHSDLADIQAIQDKIVEVPLGVDTEIFYPQSASKLIKKKLHVADDDVVMFIGQLDRPHYFKGLPVLLEAFAELRREDVKLVIIGDGDLRPSFEQIAEKLGIQHDTIFTGSIDNDKLNDYISIASFTVLPSIDKTESFGMVLLEAQSAGRGVIASNFPGVRAVVVENTDGYLVKPGDVEDLRLKIETLLDNPHRAVSFGENGRQKAVRQYDWDKVGKKLSDDLKTAVKAEAKL